MGDPVRGGTGGTKTESFCLNCHRGEDLGLFSEPLADGGKCGPDPYSEKGVEACVPACPAHGAWPPELKELQTELFQLPFWVRSNFEKARQKTPFRIHVEKAHLEAEIKPYSFISTIGQGGSYTSHTITAEPKARIFSQWDINDNQIDIGARTLLQSEGIRYEGPWWMGWPEIKFGKLYRTEEGALRVQNDLNGSLYLLNGLVEFFGGTSKEDILLNPFLPRDFTDAGSWTFPDHFDLEDLLSRLLNFTQRPDMAWLFNPNYKPSQPKDLSGAFSLNFLKPGSHITLSIEQLTDFFLPGILDLGPSHGELSLQVDKDHNLTLTLEDLDLSLEPMDYPLAKDGKRTGLRLKAGRLKAGDPVEVAHQEILRPGVHLVRSTATGNIEVQTNLGVDLELEDGTRLHTQVLFRGTLLDTPKGYQPAPDFYFAFRDTEITDAKGRAMLQDFNTEISSEAIPLSLPGNPFVEYVGGGAKIHMEGRDRQGGLIKVEGFSLLPQNEFGAVDWKDLIQGLDLNAQIDYLPPKTPNIDQRTQLRIFAEAARQECRLGEQVYSFGIEANTESLDGKNKSSQPLLEGLLGHLEVFVADEGRYRGALDLRARGLHFPDAMKKGLHVQNPSVQIEVDRVHFSKDYCSVTFPKMRVAADLNTDESQKGMVQGLFSIGQAEGKPFTVEWRPTEGQWAIEDLDWMIQAKKLAPDSGWKGQLPPGQTLGVDGRLLIDYVLNTSGELKNWNGDGTILLLGDKNGDVYLTNRNGTPVGAPVFRLTHWRFGKLHRIDVVGGYPYVETKLKTYINLSSLAPQDEDLEQKLKDAGFEQRWANRFEENNKPSQLWESGETLFELGYDNQPLSPQGFDRLNFKYFLDLYMKSHAGKLFQGVTP